MKKTALLMVFSALVGSYSLGLAQEKDPFEEQRKAFEKNLQDQSQDFDKEKSAQSDKYKAFKDKLNEAYGDYLKKNWKKDETTPAKPTDTTPKPQQTPKDQNQEQTHQDLNLKVTSPQDVTEVKIPDQKVPSILKVPVNPQNDSPENVKMTSFTYLDTQLSMPYPDNLHVELGSGGVDFDKIASYWDQLSKKDYLYFVQELMRRKFSLQLNDWAYYALLRSIGDQISGGDQNESKLFTWFMLNQSGFKARVGYLDNQVYMVVPTRSIIYGKTYYKFNNVPYFVLDAPDNSTLSLNVYEKDYPDAPNVLDLSITKSLNISDHLAYRDLKFNHKGKDYAFKIAYSVSDVQLFAYYPLTDLILFFKAPPSTITAQSLKENLAPVLAGKSEAEAVQFLLSFVQKAFDYKTDQEQFGREKSFFVEESLYYPFNDCEDRSIFFSYLVRELLGLKVIGLDYPGHVSTAVLFTQDVPGDHCEYNGQKYLICDPTYIGADIGRAMDNYKNLQANVIDLEK